MIRLTNKIPVTVEALSLNFTNLQIVRWKRKPIWMPTAKSKVFRIPPRPVIPLEEKEEIKRLFNIYRTQVKSLRKYFDLKYNISYLEDFDEEQQRKDFEEDFNKCKEINDKWNAEQLLKREKRLQETIEKEIKQAKERLEIRKAAWAKQTEDAENFVRLMKEEMKICITPENINEAIEHALSNPVDYNFAIDLDGNKILGRETTPKCNKNVQAVTSGT